MAGAKKTTSGEFRRLARLILPHWRTLLTATLLLIVASSVSLLLPWAIRDLVDSVLVNGDLTRLNLISSGLLGLLIAQSMLTFSQAWLLARVGQRLVANLRRDLQAHVAQLPLAFFNDQRTGELLSRLNNDVTIVQSSISTLPVHLIRNLITVVGALVLMGVMSWQLTLVALGLLLPVIGVALFFGQRLQAATRAMLDRVGDMNVTLQEMLAGIRVVKSFGREHFEQARYRQQVEVVFTTTMQQERWQAGFFAVMTAIGYGAIISLLWVGGYRVLNGGLTPGELIAFLFYMLMLAGPMVELSGLYGRWRAAMAGAQHLFTLLDEPAEALASDQATDLGTTIVTPDTVTPIQPNPATVTPVATAPPLRGAIRFVDVGFQYQPDRPVLENIQLEIQPEEVIALVGPSGAGKTTLVNLIPRFFEPTSGHLELDGRPATDYSLNELRQQIGLVPQDTFLFAGTIRENIGYGRLSATDSEIESAARAANAHDFIVALPNGYATSVGERGVRLSMGQRQRIAIARVLLKDPRILILDEATSSLDSASEEAVQSALEEVQRGRTTLMIAHRLSTIRRADRIAVVEQGRIVELGRHQDLLIAGGLYHRLWNLQYHGHQPMAVS